LIEGTLERGTYDVPDTTSDENSCNGQLSREYRDAVLVTDRNGAICWVKPAFCALTRHGRQEVIGANPRWLKSGCHEARFYQGLWNTILSRRTGAAKSLIAAKIARSIHKNSGSTRCKIRIR
jgi:PAS domain-containing protein